MKLRIFVDSMHGSAANCMAEIFASNDLEVISEIRKMLILFWRKTS